MKHSLIPILITTIFCGQGCKSKQKAASLDIEEAYTFQEVIKVSDFGAKVNDNIDDTEAIQNAINVALEPDKPSLVVFDAGVYDLRSGLVVARKLKDGNYGYVTITLSGPIATYALDQTIGSVTVFRSHHKGFMTAIQNGRNCVIQNIVFQGTANYTGKFKSSYSSDTTLWGTTANAKIHPNAPSCAIVIDPFHKNIPLKDQYGGMSRYYTNTHRSGTSMCLIKGCSFSAHFIAIANNTSGWCLNGDNVKAENCHAEFCYIFWAAGQDQSRANSIENLYAIHINSLVHCAYIGSGRGTPPMLEKINLAGYSKEIATIKTGFSGFNARQCYFENIEQIGSIEANYASFEQCQFKFRTYGEPRFAPAYQMHASKVASFNDCTLEYFANCTQQAPFILRAEQLKISGGYVEGGVVVADGVTNAGGDRLHNVNFDNVAIKCLNSVATKRLNGGHDGAVKNRVFVGGARFTLHDGRSFQNENPTYLCDFVENATITVNQSAKTASFVTPNPGIYRIGDNLFSTNMVTQPRILQQGIQVKTHMGYVSNIEGNRITLTGIPLITNGSHALYLVSYPTFQLPVVLKVQKGRNVAVAESKAAAKNLSVGTRLGSGYFLRGSFITKIEGDKITISTASTGTAKTDAFDYIKQVND